MRLHIVLAMGEDRFFLLCSLYAKKLMEIKYNRYFVNLSFSIILFQCPCVNLPGSNKCITYDSRYVAASLEEAILTFVDQTMDPRIFEQRTGGPIVGFIVFFIQKIYFSVNKLANFQTPATFLCSSSECRQCVGMLASRLRRIGLLRRQLDFPFPIPSENQINPNGCPRIRLSRVVNVHLIVKGVFFYK